MRISIEWRNFIKIKTPFLPQLLEYHMVPILFQTLTTYQYYPVLPACPQGFFLCHIFPQDDLIHIHEFNGHQYTDGQNLHLQHQCHSKFPVHILKHLLLYHRDLKINIPQIYLPQLPTPQANNVSSPTFPLSMKGFCLLLQWLVSVPLGTSMSTYGLHIAQAMPCFTRKRGKHEHPPLQFTLALGDPCSPAHVHISQFFLESHSSSNYSLSLCRVIRSPWGQIVFPMPFQHLQMPLSPTSVLQEPYTNLCLASSFPSNKFANRSLGKLLVAYTHIHSNLFSLVCLTHIPKSANSVCVSHHCHLPSSLSQGRQ